MSVCLSICLSAWFLCCSVQGRGLRFRGFCLSLGFIFLRFSLHCSVGSARIGAQYRLHDYRSPRAAILRLPVVCGFLLHLTPSCNPTILCTVVCQYVSSGGFCGFIHVK